MSAVPGIVAVALVASSSGLSSALQWLRQGLRFNALRRAPWWLIATAVPPAVLFGTYLVMRLSGHALPDAQITPTRAGVLLLVFLLPAVLEEVGWSGYAFSALQPRTGALRAGFGC